ncbi:hypothetical protein PMZ80_000880 [Knufia obscura]|uniref:BTB domain-containing protein n=1 Tax=Knufia obscura TaxID=1635080 RepID=A0ABR0S1I4_9EURO|nr:hypothetical protein PMZ80_000880 [Knufia obscura]
MGASSSAMRTTKKSDLSSHLANLQTNTGNVAPPSYSEVVPGPPPQSYMPTRELSPLSRYTSPNINLIVGPDQVCLTVQQHVLDKAPFNMRNDFQDMVANGCIHLPNDDPEGIAELVDWLYTNTVSPITFDKTNPLRSENEFQQCQAKAKAYVIASKYGIEALMNKITDMFVAYHKTRFVNPGTITILTRAGLRTSKLRQFLLWSFVASLLKRGMEAGNNTWTTFCLRDDQFETSIMGLDPTDMLDVLRECHLEYHHRMSGFTQAPHYVQGRCAWHTHERSHRCSGQEPGQ